MTPMKAESKTSQLTLKKRVVAKIANKNFNKETQSALGYQLDQTTTVSTLPPTITGIF